MVEGIKENEINRTPCKLAVLISHASTYDTIQLGDLEYFGNVVIDKPVTIKGIGETKPWISARSSPVVQINSPNILLENLVIEAPHDKYKLAIRAKPGTNPVLKDVRIEGDVVGVPDVRPEPPSLIEFVPPPGLKISGSLPLEALQLPIIRLIGPTKIDDLDNRKLIELGRFINENENLSSLDFYQGCKYAVGAIVGKYDRLTAKGKNQEADEYAASKRLSLENILKKTFFPNLFHLISLGRVEVKWDEFSRLLDFKIDL